MSLDAQMVSRIPARQALRRRGFLASAMLMALSGCPRSVSPPDDDLLYILQHDGVTVPQLAAASFHWLVLEPSRDGGASGDLTPAELEQLKDGGACGKTVLAYLSVGEAEVYRDYWNDAWVNPTTHQPIPGVAPAWLGPFNPDFPDNYKVRYWDPAWRAVILGTPSGGSRTPLDHIIDQGFDGVYLDIIDAFDFWSGPDGGNELTRMQARAYMIDFVETIAAYARDTRGAANFLVFPQNGADIIRNDDYDLDADADRYFAAISGIGQEDLYYDELSAQPAAETDYVLEQLREYRDRGEVVLVTDYVIRRGNPNAAQNSARATSFYDRCRAEDFTPYAAHDDRSLDTIVTFGGAGWSVAQPAPGCASRQSGEVNLDGGATARDIETLGPCMTGPLGGVLGPTCDHFDADHDSDTDLADMAAMLRSSP